MAKKPKPKEKVLIFEFRNENNKLKRVQVANLSELIDEISVKETLIFIADNDIFDWGKVDPVKCYTKYTEVNNIVEVDE